MNKRFEEVWRKYRAETPPNEPADLPAFLDACRALFFEEHFEEWHRALCAKFVSGFPFLTGSPVTVEVRPHHPTLQERWAEEGDWPADPRGWPLSIYNRAFCKQVCEAMEARGKYKVGEAEVVMRLWDRQWKRGEFIAHCLWILTYKRPSGPDQAFLKDATDFFQVASLRPPRARRRGGQLSIFG